MQKKVFGFLIVLAVMLGACVPAATPTAAPAAPAAPAATEAPAAPAAPAQTEAPAAPAATEAPAAPAAEVAVIKVGALLPLTGGDAINGQSQQQAHELAIEEINAAGGIACMNGAKLEMVYGDSQGKPEAGNSETERLITKEGVIAVMGAFHTGVTLTASEVAERYEVPFIVPNSDVSARNLKYVFQPATSIQSMAEDSAEFAKSMGDVKTALILTPNIAFGDWFAEDWAAALPAAGFEVVGQLAFPSGASDFQDTILQMKAADPDVIFTIANTADATLMTRQMKELDYWPKKAIITAAGGYSDQSYIANLGADAEGIFLTNDWFPNVNMPGAQEINDKFKAKYGVDMLGNTNTTYAGTWILKDALEISCSTDPKKLAETLRTMNLKEGVWNFMYPEMSFDDQGFNKVMLNVVAQIQGGKTNVVWPTEYAVAEAVWPVPAWGAR